MCEGPTVSLFQIKGQPYLYLSVKIKQKNNYLFTIDNEYGGINTSSIPEIDLNYEFNIEKSILHSNEFLIGLYYKTNKDKKQDIIICTANTQKESVTINTSNRLIYKINEVSFYNVSSKKLVSSIRRPDLYFSPEFDFTLNFPYHNDLVGYANVLDNNNKFCWNKELIRPFSKFYGNPCVIVLQGNVFRIDGEPDLTFISKFIQTDPLDLNLDHKKDKSMTDDEIKCQCELIYRDMGKFTSTSHLWMVVKTKHKDKKYINESGLYVIPFDISNKFLNGSLFDQYKQFKKEHSSSYNYIFDDLFSIFNKDTSYNTKNQQKNIFYLIGDDIIQLCHASFLYICIYITDILSLKNPQLFNSGKNSSKEIPINDELLYFLRKSIYHSGNIINNGNIIKWDIKSEDVEKRFDIRNNDLYKIETISKSEKFILDPRHVSINYFSPIIDPKNNDLIKVKVHFQDEFVIRQIMIKLRHRDPSQIITMKISFDEDTNTHYSYCNEIPLPNPDLDQEETYIFNLKKIAKDSLLYPIDYRCFKKFRFLTFHFRNKPEIDVNAFSNLITENDIKFIVKRPKTKNPLFYIFKSNEFKEQNFLISEHLDPYCNKKDDKVNLIANIRDFQTTRIEKGISKYESTLQLIKKNCNPSLFDIRSYIGLNMKECPICEKKFNSINQLLYYEFYTPCPMLIYHIEEQSNRSFAICQNCSNIYASGNHKIPLNSNIITKNSISSFIKKSKKYLINVNEFIDIPKLEFPYQKDKDKDLYLVSQNANVYKHTFKNCGIDEVQKLLSVNSNPGIEINEEVSLLLFFQSKVEIKKIKYDKNEASPITLRISTSHDEVVPKSSDNPLDLPEGIECQSVKLDFNPSGKNILNNIKIFGNFILPGSYNRNDDMKIISKDVIQYTKNRFMFEFKPNFDDKFKNVQTINHVGIIKGYRIQIKKGDKICSIVFAFYKNNEFISHRCILLPDKIGSKNNDNKVFYIPDEINNDHDSIKIYYLDRQSGVNVNIKIDTEK